MIALQAHGEGVILPVRAQPGARRNGIQGEHAGMLKISVTTAPERGKANAAIQEVLAAELNLRSSQIELVGGETSNQKRFLIRGIQLDQLQLLISAILSA